MKIIKAKKNINLLKEKQFVVKGEEFEVTNDRADEIIQAGFAELVEEAKRDTGKEKKPQKVPDTKQETEVEEKTEEKEG